MSENYVQLARRGYEAPLRGDLNVIGELRDPDVQWHGGDPHLEDAIALVAVESLEDAERQRFLGSPTLRIDGADVDPTADGRSDCGLKCRLYRIDGAQQTLPADEWILAAIERARESPGNER